MFCPHCGTRLEEENLTSVSQEGLFNCPQCGKSIVLASKSAGKDPIEAAVKRAGVKVKETSANAWKAFTMLCTNPIGGLYEAYQQLGLRNSLGVGFFFALLFSLTLILVAGGVVGKVFGGWIDFSFAERVKISALGLIIWLSLGIAFSIVRRMFGGKGGDTGGDALVSGVSLLPLVLWLWVAYIFGIMNLEVIGAVGIFSICAIVIILFAGCHKIAGISESLSILAVSIILILSAWITKIILTAALKNL